MPKTPTPDRVEAAFRDLRGAIYTGDGRAAALAIGREPQLDTLQYVGDGLRLALVQGMTGAARQAERHVGALRERGLDGDEDLALDLDALLGLAPAPELRDLPVDLGDLSDALEGDPLLGGGRLDLRTGEIEHIGPLFESDFFDEIDEFDESQDNDGADRWLRFDSLGSRSGYQDMVDFVETVSDERRARRLDRALAGRGAFRRFKDELTDVPDELARFFRFTDDRRRGRARQWLAEWGLRPAIAAEPPVPGGSAPHAVA